jgi:hypothetical protein
LVTTHLTTFLVCTIPTLTATITTTVNSVFMAFCL